MQSQKNMFKSIKLIQYAFLISLINLLLYYYPFFKFACNNIDVSSGNGIMLIISLTILALFLNALVFYIGLYLLRNFGKWIIVLFFVCNSIAVYFINTYGIIIDKTMMGNVFNTNFEESSSFFSTVLVGYIIVLGILPSILIFRLKIIETVKIKKFVLHIVLSLCFLLGLIYANASNWLWIDKNSKTLGGLAMPWSYVVNTNRFYLDKHKKNKKEILLPDAYAMNSEKSIVVLVIGESARSSNFSLYGYEKNTNPLLSTTKNVYHFKAESCATYTTAGVKCILEHKNTNQLYEILPNYLFRNDFEVIWRTTNWGEPNVKINRYQNKETLEKLCKETQCNYDEVLLDGLTKEIRESKKNKILIVLHTSTSHGPTYFKKYPKKFETFRPVCKSVELNNCTNEELMNAYDNSIIYTDYILKTLIDTLKILKDYKSSMLFVSDHGESLGENNLYMHGIPTGIAPKEQLEIPFIVWVSENSKTLKDKELLSQHHVFHSVLDFLGIESSIYDENMSVFK